MAKITETSNSDAATETTKNSAEQVKSANSSALANKSPKMSAQSAGVNVPTSTTGAKLNSITWLESDTYVVAPTLVLNTAATYGMVAIVNNVVNYNPGSHFNYLAVGQIAIDTFTYAIVNGKSAPVPTTVVVTITGVDGGGVPVVSEAVTTGATEAVNDYVAEALTWTVHNDTENQGSFNLAAAGNWTYEINNEILEMLPLQQGQTMDKEGGEPGIDVPNRAPVLAQIDNQVISEDAAKVITLAATDVDGDALTYSVSGGSAETVRASINGNELTLAPAANYNNSSNPIEFTVTVTDKNGAQDSKTFSATVTSVNDAPVLETIDTQALNEDVPVTISLAATDVDGDALTYSVSGGSEDTVKAEIVNGELTLTPAANYNSSNPIEFTVTATDATGAQDTKTFSTTVTPENDAPVISGVATGALTEDGETISTSGKLDATDVDQDTITWAIQTDGGNYSSVNDDYGTFSIDANDGSWTYTLSDGAQVLKADETKNSVFTVIADDGHGGETTQVVSLMITGTNDAPVLETIDTQTLNEDDSVSISLAATDVDGDALTYSVSGGSEDTVKAEIVNGELTLTPAANYNSSNPIEFTVTATDATGAQDTKTFSTTVTPENDAPVISGVATGAMTEDVTTIATGQLVATDVENNAVTWTAVNSSDEYGAFHCDDSGNWTYSFYNDSNAFNIDENGNWTYTLDNNAVEIQALKGDQSIDRNFDVTVRDVNGGETTQAVTITINGTDANVTETEGVYNTAQVKAATALNTYNTAQVKAATALDTYTAAQENADEAGLAYSNANDALTAATTALATAQSDAKTAGAVAQTEAAEATTALNTAQTEAAEAATARSTYNFQAMSAGVITSGAQSAAEDADQARRLFNIAHKKEVVAEDALDAATPFTTKFFFALDVYITAQAEANVANDAYTTAKAEADAAAVRAVAAQTAADAAELAYNTAQVEANVANDAYTTAQAEADAAQKVYDNAVLGEETAQQTNEAVRTEAAAAQKVYDNAVLGEETAQQTNEAAQADAAAANAAHAITQIKAAAAAAAYNAALAEATNEAGTITIGEDAAATAITLATTNSDGDVLTYSVSGGSTETINASISDNVLTLIPASNYNGTVPITVTVSDADRTDVQTLNVEVTPVNDAPVLTPIGAQTPIGNRPFSIILDATDVDGNGLTYSVSGGSAATVSASISDNNVLTLIPALNYNGTVPITVTVSDGTLADAETFAITIVTTDPTDPTGGGGTDPVTTYPTDPDGTTGDGIWTITDPVVYLSSTNISNINTIMINSADAIVKSANTNGLTPQEVLDITAKNHMLTINGVTGAQVDIDLGVGVDKFEQTENVDGYDVYIGTTASGETVTLLVEQPDVVVI